MPNLEQIRNFSIVAHIDHGKSTLADRLLEISGSISSREKKDQILDSMEIERERGITIKAQTARILFSYQEKEYILSFIDTPGHVDFSYEVSRALMACDGILLLIDASQGIEAQTLAHFYSASELNLTIIPVLNKIDLPNANPEAILDQIEEELLIEKEKAIMISAKSGLGIQTLLEKIVTDLPAPKGNQNQPLKALVYDAYYDSYRGVIVLVRLFDGILKIKDSIFLMYAKEHYQVEELGFSAIERYPQNQLIAGEVGYIIANIKRLEDIKIGDTITLTQDQSIVSPLEGFKEIKSFVFASIYPMDAGDYTKLKESLHKLKINDASLYFQPENSQALGAGFRCGFLGLLHFEIIQERLSREFNVSIVVSTPGVEYKLTLKNQQTLMITNPALYPNPHDILEEEEPYARITILVPETYLGNVLGLCQEKRGIQNKMNYIHSNRLELEYDIPLAEIIYDFHDRIKSISKGYATFDYDLIGFFPTKLAKVGILVNGKNVDALSFLTFKDSAYARGKSVVERLSKEIPRHMFQIPIQATIGGKIIARETISAIRKDVTSKCYGGDITRKRKLLEKQKQGKKKMQTIGNVEIPQEAFVNIFKGDMDQ